MHQGIAPSFGHIRIRRTDGWTVVTFHGEIDIASALTIGPRLDALTALPRCRVVLDLNAVGFLDASGLGLLCRARRRIAGRSGRLLLVCDRPHILRLLRLTCLDGAFTVLASLADAGPTPLP
ncbi:STAS domain-containing protein [Streptomyces violascens]|uniref:STAS domain-containing protein n=1 Tax=Streptomyces violascens TaxID=67381 RepID=UPI0037A855E1